MTPSEQLGIGYANDTMAWANAQFDAVNKVVAQVDARMKHTRRMMWVVYIGLAGHVGFVVFWAGLQVGWWQ